MEKNNMINTKSEEVCHMNNKEDNNVMENESWKSENASFSDSVDHA